MEDEKMEFRIIGVSEEAFRYPSLENLRNFNPSDSEFEFAHFYKWNALENIFGVFFKISLTIRMENEKTELLHYEGSVHYTIKNFAEIVKIDPEFSMNEIDEITLVSVAYSTVRGMIAVRTMGTPMAQYILPVIDLTQLVKSRMLCRQ